MTIPKFYTVREVAEIFRRSIKTIWRWLEEGKMFPNAKKVRDGWLIPEGDIEKILADPAAFDDPKEAKEKKRGDERDETERKPGFVKRWGG